MSKRKIVMLANAGHTPFDTRIFLKEAVSLSRNGYVVSFIVPTNRPNEMVSGVEIIPVKFHKRGWKKLIICPWLVFRQALGQSKDSIFHLHDSELLVIGICLKLTGRTVVYDAHEDTPLQIAYQHWLPWWFKKPYAWFYIFIEKIGGWMFDGIIVAEPVITKYFPPSKTVLIRNFPIVKEFENNHIDYSKRSRLLVYFGLISKVRGAIKMAKGAELAHRNCDFDFQIGGAFSPITLENEIKKYPLTFLGWLPFDKMVNVMFNARASIHVPQPIERYKTNYPIKLFEYMAAGLPVVATKYGEVAGFVREANCGILVDPEDENEIAEAIEFLFKNEKIANEMGQRGRLMVFEKYSWEKEAKTLFKFYEKLIKEV